jgi:hypothetical protein
MNLKRSKTKTIYKVHSGVPIPEKRPGEWAPSGRKYPFHEMEPGDCFDATLTLCAGTNIYSMAKKAGVRITMREVGGKIRVWRVA